MLAWTCTSNFKNSQKFPHVTAKRKNYNEHTMLPFYAEFFFFVPTPLCTLSLLPFLPPKLLLCSDFQHRATHGVFFLFFFFLLELQQSPLQEQIQFDNVCLPHSLFSDEELKKTWWPQHIHQSLFYCFNYSASQQVHHFHSVFHSLPISDWPFEPSMGPSAIVKPCLLPSQVLAVFFRPIEGSPALVQLHCSLQKDLHLTLVSSTPQHTQHIQHTRTSFFPLSSPSFLTSEKGRKEMQMLDPPELIPNSLFLISFSCVLSLSCSLIFSLCRPLWMEQLLHHRVNTLTYWTTQGKLSITTAACLFVVSLFLSLCWLAV